MKLVSKPILIGMAMGVVCNLTLLFLVVMSALGVYETSLIARLVFPYGAVINFSSDRDILILAALFLQYPLYGALFGIPWTHKKYRTLTLIVLIIVIGSCHVAAVKAANEADARWVESLPVE